LGALSAVPPRQTLTGLLKSVPDVSLTWTKLSTRTFPVLSADEESTAVMGEALQFKFNVALLKMTALDPNPVPFAEARTLTGSKRRMEFWATMEGATKAQHAAITP
jgi:hypothetical protein